MRALERNPARARLTRRTGLCCTLLAAWIGGVGVQSAAAQGSDPWAVTSLLGVAQPVGNLGHYLNAGPSFGLQLSRSLSPRLAVGIDAAYDSHIGAKSSWTIFDGPPTQVLRYGVNAEAMLRPRSAGGLVISVNGGAGLATMLSQEVYNPNDPCPGCLITEVDDFWAGEELQFEGTYPVVNGALRLEYVPSRTASFFLEGTAYYSPVDEAKTVVFVQGPSAFQDHLREAHFVDGAVRPVDVAPPGALEPPSFVSSLGVRLGFRKAFSF